MTDNQFEQIFGKLTQLISNTQVLEKDVKELKQGQDDLRAEFNEFREETSENFNKLSREERIEVRKVKMLNNDALETKAKVEDLIERVEKIEEKQAA